MSDMESGVSKSGLSPVAGGIPAVRREGAIANGATAVGALGRNGCASHRKDGDRAANPGPGKVAYRTGRGIEDRPPDGQRTDGGTCR